MGYRIKSTITIADNRGLEMPSHTSNTSDTSNTRKEHRHHRHKYKSTATSSKNTLFHHVKRQPENGNVQQNVQVEVNIDQKDDCMAGCLKALTKCFGR